jgi:hypothetical protein
MFLRQLTAKIFILLTIIVFLCIQRTICSEGVAPLDDENNVEKQQIQVEDGQEFVTRTVATEEDFFTITEGDVIAEPTIRQNVHSNDARSAISEEAITEEVFASSKEMDNEIDTTLDVQWEAKNNTDISKEMNATVWELLKAQVQKDFAPILLIADHLGLSDQIKFLGSALRNIFIGALLPMISVGLRAVKYIGDSISDIAGGMLNVTTGIIDDARREKQTIENDPEGDQS